MVALFPFTNKKFKDNYGSEALNQDNLVCRAIRYIKKKYKNERVIELKFIENYCEQWLVINRSSGSAQPLHVVPDSPRIHENVGDIVGLLKKIKNQATKIVQKIYFRYSVGADVVGLPDGVLEGDLVGL